MLHATNCSRAMVKPVPAAGLTTSAQSLALRACEARHPTPPAKSDHRTWGWHRSSRTQALRPRHTSARGGTLELLLLLFLVRHSHLPQSLTSGFLEAILHHHPIVCALGTILDKGSAIVLEHLAQVQRDNQAQDRIKISRQDALEIIVRRQA